VTAAVVVDTVRRNIAVAVATVAARRFTGTCFKGRLFSSPFSLLNCSFTSATKMSGIPKESVAGIPNGAPKGSKPIQLYSLGTPNGQKVTIALEEMGLEYDAHTIDIRKNTQFEDWFVAINPNSKIPCLVDLQGPDNKPLSLFESAAILIYLADKTGKFLAPHGSAQRYVTLSWVEWQMGGVGPMFGQTNHFHKYAPEDLPYAKNRYLNESVRLLNVLETQLGKYPYVSGADYSIADMIIFPWVKHFLETYKDKIPQENKYEHTHKWVSTILERPAVQRGMPVNKM